MSDSHFLDLGSHSVKLYRRVEGELTLEQTVTWQVMESASGVDQLAAVLASVLTDVPDMRSVEAVATAAFRQDHDLGEALSFACDRLGLRVKIIDQEAEAELLRLAVSTSSDAKGTDAINVGGGSIQIISRDGREHLLPFGISDLNKEFGLTDVPERRQIEACQTFVARQLPEWLGLFSYTGGERTYLEHFGVPMTNSWCSYRDFKAFADDMAAWEEKRLHANSPYDPRWMDGAVASNCIVLACLEQNDLDRFMPADLNIGHGVHQSLTPH
ncbi:exopolyphosphatase [Frigoribacterium sp. PhB24]|uniref:Ppx/GppA phosphatase family protein n=1 Tax=Frigoribacterium sp. PhB24 TaxID=2485204 RepID=UPI001315143D|nr:exopolyphosphatase [Frigoribacterium sp. PhB24]